MSEVAEAVAEPVRVPARITGTYVSKQSGGGCWLEWKVILPAGTTMQDLGDFPDMWAPAQADHNKSMTRDDRLFIVAHDRSWAVDCIVVDADPTKVVLNKPKVLWSGHDAGVGVAWQDDLYEIEFTGGHYEIYRKAVGNKPRTAIKGGFVNLATAKTEITRLYPRQVG